MSINLKVQVKSQTVSKKFRLPRSLVAEFDLYVEAAKEAEPAADQNAVLQAILQNQFGKDRAFQEWRERRTAAPPHSRKDRTSATSRAAGSDGSVSAPPRAEDTSSGIRLG